MKSKYVKIHWRDAVSVDAWTSAEEIIPEIAMIESVGILVTENDDIITIAINYDQSNNSYSGLMHIPKAWIIQRKAVKA